MLKRMGWVAGCLLFCLGGLLRAQQYRPVDESSQVKVTVKNTGMDVDAIFTGLEGEIRFNPSDLKNAFFSVSVDANTVSTGIDVRDANLRGADYLATQQHPRVSFVSKQVTEVKPGSYLVKGTITIKGISKEISIPFNVTPKEDGLLFAGECRLLRLDYRIGVGSLVLSNPMLLSLKVFAKKA